MNDDLPERVVFAWEPLLSTEGLWAAAAVAVVVLALGLGASAGIAPRRRVGLFVLRGVALALLAVVLAGPSRITTSDRSVREPLVILVDSSRSMQVQDMNGASRASAVGRWIADHAVDFEALRQDFDLRFFTFDESLEPWGAEASAGDGASLWDRNGDGIEDFAAAGGGGPGTGDPSPADGSGTDLGGALFGIRDRLDGRRPAGVLVVSDGADRAALGRAASDPEETARRIGELLGDLGFPVSTYAIGDPEGPEDLAVRGVGAPPFGFVRRPLTLTVDLERRALPGGPVPVRLWRDDELIESKTVMVGADEEVAVEFEVKPDRIGYQTYRVTTPVPSGDTIPGNNTLERTVKVVRDRTRVLQVTSRPAWDVKFLRRLLKTDPNVDLVSFFILRTNSRYGPLTNGSERLSLIAFPYDELFTTDLQGFDLVVFQNFSFSTFSGRRDEVYLQALADYVKAGGAFLMVGGDSSLGAADYGATPLAEILPTAVPSAEPLGTPFAPVLTEAGLRHPITRLARTAEENIDRWAVLPELQGYNPLGPLEEGGVALVKAGPGAEAPAVIAARTVGKGRSLVVGTDTTWRWALGAPDEVSGGDHSAFWRNAVRWLVKDVEQKQVQVITDRENYRLGDPVRVQVQVLGEDYAPREGAEVRGEFQRPGVGDPIRFDGVTDADGQITTTVSAAAEGTYVVSVDVPAIANPFGRGEARVSVSDREGEFEDPSTRPDVLAAIAEATDGNVLGGESPDPREMARLELDIKAALDRRVEPLWAKPWMLLLLILPLGLEWVLRRRMGLR